MEKKIFYDEPNGKGDDDYIYRASITVNGKKIYARNYGLKAFKIPVRY